MQTDGIGRSERHIRSALGRGRAAAEMRFVEVTGPPASRVNGAHPEVRDFVTGHPPEEPFDPRESQPPETGRRTEPARADRSRRPVRIFENSAPQSRRAIWSRPWLAGCPVVHALAARARHTLHALVPGFTLSMDTLALLYGAQPHPRRVPTCLNRRFHPAGRRWSALSRRMNRWEQQSMVNSSCSMR